MSQTTELIALQVLNGNVNKQTWGDIIYNVKVYGAKGDGVTDDSTVIQSTLTIAQAENGKAFLPPGDYLITDLTLLSKLKDIVGYGRLKYLTVRGTSYLPVGNIDEEVMIYVPEMWSLPVDVVNQYLQYKINLGFNVTISVADGTYEVTSGTFYAAENFPNGDLVNIIGNVATPKSCKINLYNSCIGFYAANQSSIGTINGFWIKGNGSKGGADPEVTVSNVVTWDSNKLQQGVFAEDNSTIKQIGKSVYIQDCYYGIQAASGASVTLETGDDIADKNAVKANPESILTKNVLVRGSGDVGIFAYENSVIYALKAVICYSNDGGSNLGNGIMAEYASAIWCDSSYCFGNYYAGYQARSAGSIKANSAAAWFNYKTGFLAENQATLESVSGDSYQNTSGYRANASHIYGKDAQANFNSANGVYVENGGFAYLENANADNNTSYGLFLDRTSNAYYDSAFLTNSASNGLGDVQKDPIQVPAFTSLPTASATYRGQLAYIESGAGVADTLYVCLKSAANTYSWKSIVVG